MGTGVIVEPIWLGLGGSVLPKQGSSGSTVQPAAYVYIVYLIRTIDSDNHILIATRRLTHQLMHGIIRVTWVNN